MTTRRERIIFIQALVDGCLTILRELCGVDLYTYQREMADRVFFSLLIEDAEEITIEATRQGGKSEALADIAATAMVIFPKLAALYPNDPVISKFKNGIQIGCFAPVDEQADTIFSRIVDRLTSPEAVEFLSDREINDEAHTKGNELTTNSGSLCRRQTAHAKAKIESKTYHLVIIDEAQEADATKVRKSIHPMVVATAGTIVKVGTPAAFKSDYYEAIQRNKTRSNTNNKRNHFSYNWRRAAKENPRYARTIKRERERLGEDSDEFKMSYELIWLLERGMFITDDLIEELGDPSMQIVRDYYDSPIVIGIDVARTFDSTLVTAVWVDWANPDEFGLFDHRILNWLEIHGEEWESQYAQIVEFCSHYKVMRIGVDAQGMGNPVHERLQVLMPDIEVVPMPMNPADQSDRWTHLMQLIQRRRIRWPSHSRTRRLLEWKRFIKQLSDVEKEYRGKYLLVSAPKEEKNAHDDYIDSLALACALTKDFGQDLTVEQWSTNPFLERGVSALR